ncbi:MAG TPA: hypothetical protein ENK33_03715, partial [Desulfobacterales bacterium]|nr:hypothetical protein [Desulfobacterales bacterium]
SALGDYLIFGGLIKAVEKYSDARCIVIHRGNLNVSLWPYGDYRDRFFSIFSARELIFFFRTLHQYKKQGYEIFGIQMFPGSLQGFFLFSFLKAFKLLNFRVDFNLVNADIITPPRGSYIYDIHLNQAATLTAAVFPDQAYQLTLPLRLNQPPKPLEPSPPAVAIHPWSRRGDTAPFTWNKEQWAELISFIVKSQNLRVLVFGRDSGFNDFQNYLTKKLGHHANKIVFYPSANVHELINSVQQANLIICPNTSVAHIGKALDKKMIILSGPSLEYWTPRGKDIHIVRDIEATFPGNDRPINDPRFPSIRRIPVATICRIIENIQLTCTRET